MPRNVKKINAEIGARIKAIRTSQKLTREELARMTCYSTNFIQEVECGRSGLSSESICAFSSALHISADTLLFGTQASQYDFILSKLTELSEDKRAKVLGIIEAAIELAR